MSVWPQIQLGVISKPKQWPILSKAQMSEIGFPVYGANGKIGFANQFTHEKPTILIGCRGSCGSVHITEPRSYANGNAMALDDLDEVRADPRYVFRFLQHRGFDDVTTGTSQPQIIRQNLVRVEVPLPALPEQRRIAAILDEADALRAKRRAALAQLDEMARAIFVEMFGDPVTNSRGWPVLPAGELGQVVTGNTPSRAAPEYYGNAIEWIKSDNLNTPHYYATRAEEGLSAEGKKRARIAPPNSVLVTCIAGSPAAIGNAAMLDREVAFNQQINALIPDRCNPHFIYAQIRVGKALIQAASTAAMKGMVSKSKFEQIRFIAPPRAIQDAFSERALATEVVRIKMVEDSVIFGSLFASLQHRAFRGEL